MATKKAKALFPYASETEGDLCFDEGVTIEILDTNVEDEGWWLGRWNGKTGYFPQNYVEMLPDGAPTVDASNLPPPPANMISPDPEFDDDDDDDDDDDELGTADDISRSALAYEDMFTTGTSNEGAGGVRASVMFAPEDSGIIVDQHNEITDSLEWLPTDQFYSVSVAQPEAKRKYAGVKKYVAYVVTTQPMGWSVSRRYKHFNWLRDQLVEKFPSIPIPALPSKQVSGRFEDDFIEARRVGLCEFLNRLARHPVLRRAEVVHHFLSVDNDDREKEWKAGKRKAEKDPIKGKVFYDTIMCNANPDEFGGGDAIDAFKAMLLAQDNYLKGLNEAAHAAGANRISNAKALESLGGAITAFGGSNEGGICHKMDCGPCGTLSEVLQMVGEATQGLAEREKSQIAAESMLEEMTSNYRTIAKGHLEVAKIEAGARSTYTSTLAKQNRQTRLATLEEKQKLQLTKERADRIACATMAEIAYFHDERVHDYKKGIREYITMMADYHRQVAQTYENLLPYLDSVPADISRYEPAE